MLRQAVDALPKRSLGERRLGGMGNGWVWILEIFFLEVSEWFVIFCEFGERDPRISKNQKRFKKPQTKKQFLESKGIYT